ncbi:MAG: hypothetical protein KAU01_11290 [Candidatus Cloacimonetes bacterium]|nr:hypothetical protein [Candidatus Cloacimonadota bacterium]
MDSNFLTVSTFFIFAESVIFGLMFSFSYLYTKNLLGEVDAVEVKLNKYKKIIKETNENEKVELFLSKVDLKKSPKKKLKKKILKLDGLEKYIQKTIENITGFFEITDLIIFMAGIFWVFTTIWGIIVIAYIFYRPCGNQLLYITPILAIVGILSILFLIYKFCKKYFIKNWILIVMSLATLGVCWGFWILIDKFLYVCVFALLPCIITSYIGAWFLSGFFYKPLTSLFLLRKFLKRAEERAEELNT